MYNTVSASTAAKLDRQEISVKDFLASDWTDHVYLIPADYKTRKCYCGIQVSHTEEESEKILKEKYIDNMAMYSIREKDFGDNVISYWIYLDVIVPVEEYEAEFQKQFGRFLGGK